MGQVSWGGAQIEAKSWIFQTELGPIPITRCDQRYAFSHAGGIAFQTTGTTHFQE